MYIDIWKRPDSIIKTLFKHSLSNWDALNKYDVKIGEASRQSRGHLLAEAGPVDQVLDSGHLDTMKLSAQPGQHGSAQAGNGNCLGWLHSHRSERTTSIVLRVITFGTVV